MTFDCLNLGGMPGNVAVVPDSLHRVVCHVGVGRNFRDLDGDGAPTALCLHGPQGDGSVRLAPAMSGGMRNRIEPIGCGNGPYPYRLKKDIEA
ncbi:MAG: hypothetical protein J4F49_06700 [Rhodobacteraceae bacterium]|nr:hypothetical protein [Paracoccaceae bacterium]